MASKRQQAALKRIQGIDPSATHTEVEDWVVVSYVPAWEKGRTIDGSFRPNPNPQVLTFGLDPTGRQWGWGFGQPKSLPKGVVLSDAESIKDALKTRRELRNPPKPKAEEPTDAPTTTEDTAEATIPKPKRTTRKRSTAKRTAKAAA